MYGIILYDSVLYLSRFVSSFIIITGAWEWDQPEWNQAPKPAPKWGNVGGLPTPHVASSSSLDVSAATTITNYHTTINNNAVADSASYSTAITANLSNLKPTIKEKSNSKGKTSAKRAQGVQIVEEIEEEVVEEMIEEIAGGSDNPPPPPPPPPPAPEPIVAAIETSSGDSYRKKSLVL